MLVLMGGFLLISRRTLRLPRALWLLPLGCLLAYLANAVRIAALILLGTHVSEDIALGASTLGPEYCSSWPSVSG